MTNTLQCYEKQGKKPGEVLIWVDGPDSYSIASNLDPEPDGFVKGGKDPSDYLAADPIARGYKPCSIERATEVLGYDLEEE